MSKRDIDELVHWRDTCEALAASLQRKVRHCDEITEERDKVVAERDEALAEVKTWKRDWYVAKADLGTAMRLADVALRDVAEKYERALRERDEARAEVERSRKMAHDFEVMREDRINCWRERAELMRVNKGVARHGIITESVRQLTEMLGIERQNQSANETTDAAAVEIKRLRAELLKVQTSETAPWADVRRAYIRGAEAMREACAQWIPHLLCTVDCDPEESMRALPIPEEP